MTRVHNPMGVVSGARWNGEPVECHRVRARVAEAEKPTFWYAALTGQIRTVLEIKSGNQVFHIDDEEGCGTAKVLSNGMWTRPHRSIQITEIVMR